MMVYQESCFSDSFNLFLEKMKLQDGWEETVLCLWYITTIVCSRLPQLVKSQQEEYGRAVGGQLWWTERHIPTLTQFEDVLFMMSCTQDTYMSIRVWKGNASFTNRVEPLQLCNINNITMTDCALLWGKWWFLRLSNQCNWSIWFMWPRIKVSLDKDKEDFRWQVLVYKRVSAYTIYDETGCQNRKKSSSSNLL